MIWRLITRPSNGTLTIAQMHSYESDEYECYDDNEYYSEEDAKAALKVAKAGANPFFGLSPDKLRRIADILEE